MKILSDAFEPDMEFLKVEVRVTMKGLTEPAIILRLANVYGGLNDYNERLVPSILSKAMLDQTIQVVGGMQKIGFFAYF